MKEKKEEKKKRYSQLGRKVLSSQVSTGFSSWNKLLASWVLNFFFSLGDLLGNSPRLLLLGVLGVLWWTVGDWGGGGGCCRFLLQDFKIASAVPGMMKSVESESVVVEAGEYGAFCFLFLPFSTSVLCKQSVSSAFSSFCLAFS